MEAVTASTESSSPVAGLASCLYIRPCPCNPAGAKSIVGAKNFKAHVVVDGEEADGEVAAITIANAAPPFSVLAHGHTGDCIYDGEWGDRLLAIVKRWWPALFMHAGSNVASI